MSVEKLKQLEAQAESYYVVNLKRTVNDPINKKYVNDDHIVVYDKENFKINFQEDAEGNPIMTKTKDEKGREIQAQKPTAMASVIEFESKEILHNPYKDNVENWCKVHGLQLPKKETKK